MRMRPADVEIWTAQRRVSSSRFETAKGPRCLHADVSDVTSLRRILLESRPDLVINAAGEGNVDKVEGDYIYGERAVLRPAQNLATVQEDYGYRIAHISSTTVFGGDEAPYSETDSCNPLNTYGYFKAKADDVVMTHDPEALIVRPTFTLGTILPGQRQNLFSTVTNELKRNRSIHVVDDVRENSLTSIYLGEIVWKLVAKNLKGLVHVGSRRPISRFDLAKRIAELNDLPVGLIQRAKLANFSSIAPRPKDSTVVVTTLEESLGESVQDVESLLHHSLS